MEKLFGNNVQTIVIIVFGLILNLIFYKIGVNVELIAILTSGFVLVGLFSKQIYKFSFGSTGIEIQLQELQKKYDALSSLVVSSLSMLYLGRWHGDDMEKVINFVFDELLPKADKSLESEVVKSILSYKKGRDSLESQFNEKSLSEEEFLDKHSQLTDEMISIMREVI